MTSQNVVFGSLACLVLVVTGIILGVAVAGDDDDDDSHHHHSLGSSGHHAVRIADAPGASLLDDDDGSVRTSLVCVHRRDDECTALISIFTATEQSIPVGPRNFMSPGDRDRGQPTTFAEGNWFGAAQPAWNCADGEGLTWTLDGTALVIPGESLPCPKIPTVSHALSGTHRPVNL